MENDLGFKATVTGKRQITIPKEICELLGIENGNQVIFKKEDNHIIFDLEKEDCQCFACNGTGNIEGNMCFVCRGGGRMTRDICRDAFKLLWIITKTARKYGVSISFEPFSGNGEYDFPVVKFESSKYSDSELQRIQDEFQKRIIMQLCPKSTGDNHIPCIPSREILNGIISNISSESVINELRKYFRLNQCDNL